MQTYLVTALHSSPDYCFTATPVSVHRDYFGPYFADHEKLGCGKNYPTPSDAIHGLFSDHGCRVITMTEA